MKLHLQKRDDILLIQSCELAADAPRHRMRIGGDWYARSVIITPRGVEMWAVEDAQKLCLRDFERLAKLAMEMRAEVLLLGAGRCAAFPHASVTKPLMRARIGLEVMDTAAACRTYNALAGDGRVVAAALIA